jgi:hypothetical protein
MGGNWDSQHSQLVGHFRNSDIIVDNARAELDSTSSVVGEAGPVSKIH